MIIPHHGVLQLLVTSCVLAIVFCAPSETNWTNDEVNTLGVKNETQEQKVILQTTETDTKSDVSKLVKSHRRAPRYDSAGSNSWVRIYHRPPGTKESFYSYETRSNTSAHTSGEAWDPFKDQESVETDSSIRRSDGKFKDILRVKPKQKETIQNDIPIPQSKTTVQTTTQPVKSTLPPFKSTTQPTKQLPTLKSTSQPIRQLPTLKSTSQPVKQLPPSKSTVQPIRQQPSTNDNQNRGFITWTSNDGGSNSGWTFEDTPSTETEKLQPSLEKIIPKDGSQWKVVGEGGEDGWEVIDDKGKVEWKIEYDDGEWRVTSTGDIPEDAEWIDPDYIWGPTDGSVSEDDQYNAWPADDYKIAPGWIDPESFLRGLINDSKSVKDYDYQVNKQDTRQSSKPGWKIEESSTKSPVNKDNFRFGIRRRIPTNEPTSTVSTEEIVNTENSEAKDDIPSSEQKPQSDEAVTEPRSRIPGADVIRGGQKWVQSYGSKTWEGDNSGWNAEVGGETWVEANKNYDPWVPKVTGAEDVSQKPPPSDDTNTSKQDSSIRAWGTGYGSKTWKGAEWDSNVVWKTGFNSGLPWANDNSTWKFPDDNQDKKKPEVWSQPIPSSGEISDTDMKTTNTPSKNPSGVRIKWPIRPINRGNAVRKQPPSRRTEGESWSDDTKTGGVEWQQNSDVTKPTPGPMTPKPSIPDGGWKIGGWKISTSSEEGKPASTPWKNNAQPKDNNLINAPWQTEESIPIDPAPYIWNQEQWPDYSDGPTWIFSGCQMSLKCGSKDIDDSSYQSNIPEKDDPIIPTTTPMPTTPPVPALNVGKGWPVKSKGGKSWRPPTKSWKPPTKSWKPPKWIQSTPPPPPTPETMNPTMTWKPAPPTPKWKKPAPPPGMWKQPPPVMMWPETTPAPAPPMPKWKKPAPPPGMWKQPPPVMMWPETTPAPAPPSMPWKPPPPPMKWKKGPKPTKSWRPPPTKSWKPPMRPNKTWQPSIATPPPDMWPTTKPDCKDMTEPTQPPQQPNPEDDGDMMEPPQIIIITKLPKSPAPNPDIKKDKGNPKGKPQFGPWMFPPRRNVPKSSKNRKDKNISIPIGNYVKNRPSRPGKNSSKQPNRFKGWPKGMPPPNFVWPSTSMRRWTTKRPQTSPTWKFDKYSKAKSWRQMLRKWMSGR